MRVIILGFLVVGLAFSVSAADSTDDLTLEECLRHGERAYVRGDYVRAMVLFTRAVAMEPDNKDALMRLEFVAEELQFLDDHYKEWLRLMSEQEADHSRKLEEKVDEAITVLRAESARRISELRRDNIHYVSDSLRRQDATIRDLEKKLNRFRLLSLAILLVAVGGITYGRRKKRK